MKQSRSITASLILCISALILSSCASGPKKIQTFQYQDYFVENPKQVEKGLSVELVPLGNGNYKDHVELYGFTKDDLPSDWRMNSMSYYPEVVDGKNIAYTFGVEKSIVAFSVKIENNTGHILRMGDARIYLRVEDEEPIKAFSSIGNPNLVNHPVKNGSTTKFVPYPASYIDNDNSVVDFITRQEIEWDQNREKPLLSLTYHYGTLAQVIKANKKNYKLINSVDKEILPGDTYSGLLVFPALVSWPEAEVKFYDVTTQTDAAGNPTEKVTLNFKCKLQNGQYWWDSEKKEWIPGDPPSVSVK